MTAFALVRHGEPDWHVVNQLGLPGAAADWAPLTNQGEAQIAALAEHPMIAPTQLILASPMTRALQSAAIIATRLALPLAVEVGLREWLPDVGYSWHGPSVPDQSYKEMVRLGGEWPPGETRPWEPRSSVRRRALAALQKYRHLDHVAVLCHGGIIYSLIDIPQPPLAAVFEYAL